MLFAWKRRMTEGGTAAVAADEDVVGSSGVRELERQVRDLERLLGRQTMEVEILKEALDVARVKDSRCSSNRGARTRTVPDEGDLGHPRGRPLEPDRADIFPPAAANRPTQAGRRRPARFDPADCRCPPALWLPADYRAGEPRTGRGRQAAGHVSNHSINWGKNFGITRIYALPITQIYTDMRICALFSRLCKIARDIRLIFLNWR